MYIMPAQHTIFSRDLLNIDEFKIDGQWKSAAKACYTLRKWLPSSDFPLKFNEIK